MILAGQLVAEFKWFMAFTVEPVNTLGYKNRQHGTGQGDPALKSRDEHVEIKFAVQTAC